MGEKNTQIVTENKEKAEELTEFTKIRMSYGLKQQEVAEEIGISGPVYSLQERQARNTTKKTSEKLFYNIHHAAHRILKRKKEMAEDLELNSYRKPEGVEFESIEDEIQAELDAELHYYPLTDELFSDILVQYIYKEKTVVRAAAETGVCELELKKRLIKEGIPFEMGDNWEKLV